MKRNIISLLMVLASTVIMAQTKTDISTVSIGNEYLQMSAINYGARIQSLKVNKEEWVDVVLGFDEPEQYTAVKQNFGAVVGRYIGRILGGRLTIDGMDYQLQTSPNGDCSHGGTPSFSQQMWTVMEHTPTSMTMRYVSPDGENGFPGELTLDVRYTLEGNALRIDYEATTTKPTVLNPSNHSFFNLSGNLGGDVMDESLWINSDSIALYDSNKRVTGRLGSVVDTPFDFRQRHLIGERIDAPNDQLLTTKGYDQCFQLCSGGDISIPAARLEDARTHIIMEVFTTEPAMQIYTANSHNGSIKGKEGLAYGKGNAICFETMHYPDSPNKPWWPSTLLRPDEKFHSTTIFKFY